MNHNNHHSSIRTKGVSNSPALPLVTTELVLRPTEAQLRWAQFHHQRRALEVREKIQRLYQTPESVSDVDGALTDDGNSSSSSNDSNAENNRPLLLRFHRDKKASRRNHHHHLQKQKPTISRGRRALLRVSKRAYEKRRLEILAHGFLGAVGDDNDDTDNEDVENRVAIAGGPTVETKRQPGRLKQRQMLSLQNSNSEEPPEDGVDAIFAEEAAWKKKRKRRHARRFIVSDDEDRVRRFEAAFHAMMMNLSASQQQQHPEPVISPSGKRWTRAVPVAVSIDGRHYDDLKWGVTFRTSSSESPTSGTGSNSMTPMDRGATWMIHLPSKPKQQPRRQNMTVLSDNDEEDHMPQDTPSAGRMKFNSLVAMLQQRTMVKLGPDLMERRVPRMRLRLGKEQDDAGDHLPPISSDKRWTKPESRTASRPESGDANDESHNCRNSHLDHPYQVEFVVDGQHYVMSPHFSDSSGLPSPTDSNGPQQQHQQQRWTFTGPATGSPESDAVTDLFAALRGADTPQSAMGESVKDSDVYAPHCNGNTPKSDADSDVWCAARQVSPKSPPTVNRDEADQWREDPQHNVQREEGETTSPRSQQLQAAGTPKSLAVDSVSDSDVYSALLRSGNQESETPQSTRSGQSYRSADSSSHGSPQQSRQLSEEDATSPHFQHTQVGIDRFVSTSPHIQHKQVGDDHFASNKITAVASNVASSIRNRIEGATHDGDYVSQVSSQTGRLCGEEEDTTSPHFQQLQRVSDRSSLGTPKSLTGESIADSDVYSALRNGNAGNDGATPRSVQDGESDVWREALQISPTAKQLVIVEQGARRQRLQHAQDINEGKLSSRLAPLRLLPDDDSSPSKKSVGSLSSSEVSPANVKGIWRSARNAAGAALNQLSASVLIAGNEDVPQKGADGNKNLAVAGGVSSSCQASNGRIDPTPSRNSPPSRILKRGNGDQPVLSHISSGRSSESSESRFWDDVRTSGNQSEQSVSGRNKELEIHISSTPSNLSGLDRRPRELDVSQHDESYAGVNIASSDSESSVWKMAFDVVDMKSPSSLPSIPERLAASDSIREATKENYQYPMNDTILQNSQSNHGKEKRDVDSRGDESDDNSNASKGSDVWRMLRNQAKVGGRLLNIIPESKSTAKDHTSTTSTLDKSADIKSSITQTAARAVGSIGGVLKMLSTKKENCFGEETKEDEMKAVAAFRKTQEERRNFDSKSTSTLSYGVLPESIRQAVQQYGSPKVGQENNEGVQFEADPAQNSDEIDDYDEQEYDSTVDSAISHSIGKMSPERARDMHQMVMMNSVLIGDKETEHTIIDTDDTTSSASIDGYNPRVIASLMLSPALLTKRLHQAIRAIKKRNWEQVSYLLSANPWLAEMVDVTTNQYLLHKLALYGGGACEIDPLTGEVVNGEFPPAPEQLNTDLLRMFPASVHKFDKDGNLPLHMASASGNINMIKLLASRFPEGASVRNEEGMLPLHLIILACASPGVARNAKESPKQMVETLLGHFRGAVAVTDNDGNLPIHSAAISLVGEAGVDVVYLLMDEADRQASDPYGPRFAAPTSKVHTDCDSLSVATVETTSPTDSSHNGDDLVRCNAVRNHLGETALMAAINARAGWEMIEAIASSPGGREAVLSCDSNKNTALHLLLRGDSADPAAVLSILKIAPQAATRRNDEGILPIEVACLQSLPREVIVALLLVDLPIDLDDKEGIKIVEGYGGSWWFLTCECDDQYVDVVEEIVSICSYQQIREMCFMKGGHIKDSGPVVSRATPKCREVLLRALRFVGRFEFLGSASINSDARPGVKVFDALDFGTDEAPFDDGRRVLLYCFASESYYLQETAVRRAANLHASFVEETFDFVVHEDGTDESPPQQFCVAVESPTQTLNRVVAGMLDNRDYERKPELRKRYMFKVCLVLRQIAKALSHLHTEGVIHADLCLENCGKFGDKWKLASTMGIQNVGKACDPTRLGESAPPEAVELVKRGLSTRQACFKSNLATHPSMDIWAFGKLAYEALVGEPLLDFDTTLEPKDDSKALSDIMKWNKVNLNEVAEDLAGIGLPKTGIDLITQCLMPQPHKRPPSMERILSNPFWKEIQRLSSPNKRSPRESRSQRRSS